MKLPFFVKWLLRSGHDANKEKNPRVNYHILGRMFYNGATDMEQTARFQVNYYEVQNAYASILPNTKIFT